MANDMSARKTVIDSKHIGFALAACLTLGLAPFTPEPHIVGKLKWIAGGAEGMAPIDWFDTALHGAPWIVLAVLVLLFAVQRLKRSRSQ